MTALADATDPRFTAGQRAHLARFEAAEVPAEVVEAGKALDVDWFKLPNPEPTGPLTGGLITPENPVGGLRPANRGDK